MADDEGLITAAGIDAAQVSIAMVRDTNDHYLLISTDGTVVGCNRKILDTGGYTVEGILGRSVFDLIDPRDLDRAVRLLPLASDEGAPGGVASFGILKADGTPVTADVSADSVFVDGQHLILFRGRPVYLPQALDRLLDGLLGGAPLHELFAQVPECIAWREDASLVAISWQAEGRPVAVDTGLDRRLTGVDPDVEPWATLRVRGGSASGSVDELPPNLAELASGLGLTNWWIVVVDGPGDAAPVLVTIFGTKAVSPVVALHTAGMEMARRYIQVILRWTDQVARLEVAAHHDPLTGLPNRRRFLDAIETGDRGGAVLYCDLDGFKPVNDRWGHPVGDEVLVEVGRRLRDLVRDDDLVARVGGDEFAVVLWDADAPMAEQVASRIREVCRRPIAVSAGEVEIGISVGVATGEDRLHHDHVADADAALYADKASGRGDATQR